MADPLRRHYWDKTVATEPPMIDYQAVMESEVAVGRWTSLIVRISKTLNNYESDQRSASGVFVL